MRWLNKVLFYNLYHFYGSKFFKYLPIDEYGSTTKSMEAFLTLDFGYLLLYLWYCQTGFLMPIFMWFLAMFLVEYIAKRIFYKPELGGDRWKEVLKEDKYGTPLCKTIAFIWASANIFGPFAFVLYLSEVVNAP